MPPCGLEYGAQSYGIWRSKQVAYLRRELVSPVAERVYVDMESSRIGAIVAEAESRRFWKARW